MTFSLFDDEADMPPASPGGEPSGHALAVRDHHGVCWPGEQPRHEPDPPPEVSRLKDAFAHTGPTLDGDERPIPLGPEKSVGTVPVPLDSLDPELAAAVRAVHMVAQVGTGLALQSVLGAVNLPLQRWRNVRLPHGTGQTRPISLFLLSIAESGERKSTANELALQAAREVEEELRLAAEAVGSGNDDDDAEEGPASSRLEPNLLLEEGTVDGILKLLRRSQPSIGLFSDAGAQMLSGHAMMPEVKARTYATLSKGWDGKALSRVRVQGGAAPIVGRRFAVHLMVQPGIADALTRDQVALQQGILARVLPSEPEALAGSRWFREPEPAELAALEALQRRLAVLWALPAPLRPGSLNELKPPAIGLSPAARVRWIDFYDESEAENGPRGRYRAVKGWNSKAGEHVCRLAANLALFADPHAAEIGLTHLEAAIALVRYYREEALRKLVQHKWLVPIPGGARILGRTRREAWRLNPLA
jgi:hypothetical protein